MEEIDDNIEIHGQRQDIHYIQIFNGFLNIFECEKHVVCIF